MNHFSELNEILEGNEDFQVQKGSRYGAVNMIIEITI